MYRAGPNVFSSKPATAILDLVTNLQEQVAKGKKNIARIDENTGELVVNKDYLKSKSNELFGKRATEHSKRNS